MLRRTEMRNGHPRLLSRKSGPWAGSYMVVHLHRDMELRGRWPRKVSVSFEQARRLVGELSGAATIANVAAPVGASRHGAVRATKPRAATRTSFGELVASMRE